jgi:pyruvate/oxaloacetate carboxyltransferase
MNEPLRKIEDKIRNYANGLYGEVPVSYLIDVKRLAKQAIKEEREKAVDLIRDMRDNIKKNRCNYCASRSPVECSSCSHGKVIARAEAYLKGE